MASRTPALSSRSVAVGNVSFVAPPHRTVRTAFPHTAPTSEVRRQMRAVCVLHDRERPIFLILAVKIGSRHDIAPVTLKSGSESGAGLVA